MFAVYTLFTKSYIKLHSAQYHVGGDSIGIGLSQHNADSLFNAVLQYTFYTFHKTQFVG